VVIEQLAGEVSHIRDAGRVERDRLGDREQLVAEDTGEKAVLPAEVGVDALAVYSCRTGDLIDGRSVGAARGKQLASGSFESGRDVFRGPRHRISLA
jgi:hypothetical protein